MVSGSESFDMGREAERLTVADETVALMLGAGSGSESAGGREASMLWVRCNAVQVSLGDSK